MSRHFDGNGSGGDVLGSSATAIGTLPMTVSFWMWSDAATGNYGMYMFETDDAGAFSGNRIRVEHESSDNKIQITGPGISAVKAANAQAQGAAAWFHVCARIDQSAQRICVAGDLGNEGSGSGTISGFTAARISIGGPRFFVGFGDVVTNGFNGNLCGFGLWNTLLTDAEVTQLANGAHPRFIKPANLKMAYDLTQYFGNDANGEADIGGSGMHLFSNTGPAYVHQFPPTLVLP